MTIKIHNNKFHNVGTAMSFPKDWDGDVDATMNSFTNVGKALEIRDASNQPIRIEVPTEIARLALETYAKSIYANGDKELAIQKIGEQQPIRNFLQAHGFEISNLSVGIAQLVTALIK